MTRSEVELLSGAAVRPPLETRRVGARGGCEKVDSASIGGAGRQPIAYFVGSAVSFTVCQFLSARLIFSASFLRHSLVQYLV
jgi:hypothetical protein